MCGCSRRLQAMARILTASDHSLSRAFHGSALGIWLLLASPLIFGITAVLMGKDGGWDLQNYHWYNPYALLTQRLGFDVAVGQHATYYNPLADLPFYLIASQGPPWLAGAFLGALFGIAVAMIGG